MTSTATKTAGKNAMRAVELFDRGEALRALAAIVADGKVFEVRALDATTADDRRPHTESGYFDDAHKAVEALKSLRSAKGIYVTANPCAPPLLARAVNRMRNPGREPLTSDVDIEARRWLLVDCDAVRPVGISSTDDEHEAAIRHAGYVRATLAAEGWPEPLLADSANGAHLMYRVELPAADGGLVERCTMALVERFTTPTVEIDRKVHNASRIWRWYGTRACKGDSTADRPHRLSTIIDLPATLAVVPEELLQALAATAPKPEPPKSSNGNSYAGATFDLDRWIADHGLNVREAEPYQGGRRWVFNVCPWNESHTNLSAVIIQRADGKIGAMCQHDGCTGNDWPKLRALYEPGYADRRNGSASSSAPRPRTMASRDELAEFGIEASDNGDGYHTDDDAEPTPAAKAKGVKYTTLTSRELDDGRYETEYLIERTLVAGQPCILAGAKKSLKTSIIIDAAISLASGGPFLGELEVSRTARVIIMSGESGLATIQETARRVAESKGLYLRDLDGIIWSTDLPRIGDLEHEMAVAELLRAHQADVLAVDPVFLCMSGADAANLFVQGSMLQSITRACQAERATLILAHHTKRGVVDPNQPPELDDIAWAGFPEWARQWILLGRRERYEPGSGRHRLWLNAGGSAGHSALWALDINEGVYDGHARRRWEVSLGTANDARQAVGEQKEQARQTRNAEKLEAHKKAVLRAAAKFPEGATKNQLREHAGMSGGTFNPALAACLDDGSLVACTIKKQRGPIHEGYKLSEEQA